MRSVGVAVRLSPLQRFIDKRKSAHSECLRPSEVKCGLVVHVTAAKRPRHPLPRPEAAMLVQDK